MISEHATEWLGLPVRLFDAKASEKGVSDYANTIYRLALDWEEEVDFSTLFTRFLSNPASAQTPAIIIGKFFGDDPSDGSGEVVKALADARAKLPNLRGIFLGDLLSEECEISWLNQCDVSPLIAAYPNLEHLRIRGSNELSLGGGLKHSHLKSLTIETGGLDPEILGEILASQLPALDSLEIWLGTSNYGGDASIDDLQPLLSGKLFPTVTHLGLRDSEIVNQIADALKSAPILSRLKSLDLSLGSLSDEGAEALLANPALKSLKQIDLHYHYLSKEMMARLKRELPAANLDDPQGEADEDDRYVAVGE